MLTLGRDFKHLRCAVRETSRGPLRHYSGCATGTDPDAAAYCNRAGIELSSPNFSEHWERGALPAAIAAVHIRAAVGALDELIGAVDTEDVLSRVFATFCIGK